MVQYRSHIEADFGQFSPELIPPGVPETVCNGISPVPAEVPATNFNPGWGLATFILGDIQQMLDPPDIFSRMSPRDNLVKG